MEIFKIELKRAFNNKKFWIAIGIGFLLSIYNFYSNFGLNEFYEFGVEYQKYNLEAPNNLFTSNIISSPMELPITLFLYSVVILGALPFADSYVEDKVTGYSKNLLSRSNRRDYFISKWVNVFITGFVVSMTIIIFNFMLNITIMPLLHPFIEGAGNSYNQETSEFLKFLFVEHPVLHHFLFAILLSLYVGTFSSFGLLTSAFSDNRFIAILTPFLLTQAISVIQNSLRIANLYTPKDINTGNGQIDLKFAILEVVVLSIISFVVFTFVENKRRLKLGV